MTKRGMQIALVLGLAALFGLLYVLWPGLRTSINQISSLLARADIERLREYLLSFGIWAPIVSATLMVFQSVVFPLPAFVITFTNGLLFGAWWGTLLSWSSAMVGAAVCFFIARALGRPVVERLVGKKSLDLADRFFKRYGRHAILIARLIPIVSFDVISYAAGLTSVSLSEFLIATGIGQLPATVVYSVLGQNMTKTAQFGLWALGGVLALLVFALALKAHFDRRLSSKRMV